MEKSGAQRSPICTQWSSEKTIPCTDKYLGIFYFLEYVFSDILFKHMLCFIDAVITLKEGKAIQDLGPRRQFCKID